MSRVRTEYVETPQGTWELANAPAHPSLRTLIDGYGGYVEHAPAITRRLEMPFPRAALILNFGDPIGVSNSGLADDLVHGYSGFLAGLADRPALVESNGAQTGVQANLTPLGAYHLFGLPMAEITNQTVRLEDLLGTPGHELIERLREARSWEARFDLLDALFVRALSVNRPPTEAIAWAWREIAREPSTVNIGRLANETGWSHKHFINKFRDEVGVAPKTAARIVRFHRVVQAITPGKKPAWGDVAVAAGYYDQAHMGREFREFARCTPTELWLRRLADGGVYGGALDEAGG